MFGYHCPSCSQRLLAAPERAGQRTICPKCLRPIVIPRPVVDTGNDSETTTIVPEPTPDVEPFNQLSINPFDYRSHKFEAGPAAHSSPMVQTTREVGGLRAAAAVLVGQSESMVDLVPIPESPAASTVMPPIPLPLPMPSFPEPRPVVDSVKSAVPSSVGYAGGSAFANDDRPAGLTVFHAADQNVADLIPQLATRLVLKLEPSPEPPGDLRLTTGLWILMTIVGLALGLYCLVSDTRQFITVALIGTVELLIGYCWVAIAYGKRDLRKVLTTLIPPLWVYRAANPPCDPGYRPLRFVATGAILLALYVIAPQVQPRISAWIGNANQTQVAGPEKPTTLLMELLSAERDGDSLGMKRLLSQLARAESMIVLPPHEKPAVIAAVSRLSRHEQSEIRIEALQALVRWSRDDARETVFAWIRSGTEEEREAAYRLIANWSDAETVRLIVSQLGRNSSVRPALDEIGKTAAGRLAIEDAILPLVRANGLENRFELLALASECGGERMLTVLEEQLARARTSGELNTLPRCIAKIKARLGR